MTRPEIARAGLLALVVCASVPAAAQMPGSVESAAGRWDLVAPQTNRKCPLMLRAVQGASGYDLRFPATCRRALPLVANLAGWTVEGAGLIRLLDASGKPVLAFAAQDGGLVAKSPEGETFALLPEGRSLEQARTPRPPPVPPPGVPQLTSVDPNKAPKADTLPGSYALDRYQERDVCRLTLSAAPVAADGRFGVSLLDGCRDKGIAIFDPASWRYENGRLTLYSRRGHSVEMVFEDKVWRRDPAVGTTLNLRKLGE